MSVQTTITIVTARMMRIPGISGGTRTAGARRLPTLLIGQPVGVVAFLEARIR
jgi:hypothetical protein